MPTRQKIKLGDRYRDKVTGYEGVTTAEYVFVSGCVQYNLVRLDKDGKLENECFDEQRLERVKAEPKTRVHRTGADHPAPANPTH
jgi:hypothetical protein